MSTLTLARRDTATPDYAAIKQRQQATWAAGDYAIIGTTLQIVGECLCEAIDLRAGERVLDVAAGNGNATLAAARRFAQVTSTDYVPALLDRGKKRAAAERLPVAFQVVDAEALPFADASFDAALSTFGIMFTPDQESAVREITRVVRPGGRIGFANWTPDAPLITPSAQHLISYHLVTSGSWWAIPAGSAPVRLETGDVIVFPRGVPHVMCSDPEDAARHGVRRPEHRAGGAVALPHCWRNGRQ
jgi:SAM-dependent methyltransferase